MRYLSLTAKTINCYDNYGRLNSPTIIKLIVISGYMLELKKGAGCLTKALHEERSIYFFYCFLSPYFMKIIYRDTYFFNVAHILLVV